MRRHSRLDLGPWLFAAVLCIAWTVVLPSGASGAAPEPDAAEAGSSAFSTDALARSARVRSLAAGAAEGWRTGAAPAALLGRTASCAAAPPAGHHGSVDYEHSRRSFLDRVSYRTTGPPLRIV